MAGDGAADALLLEAGRLPKRRMSNMGASFLRGVWPEDMNMIEPVINTLVYFAEAPSREAFINSFKKHIWPIYQFNSCMEDGGYWLQRHQEMDCEYHFKEVEVNDEADIVEFTNNHMMEVLDRSYPVWNLTILRTRTAASRSAVFFRVHHTIGDGIGLLLACSPTMSCEGGDVLGTVPLLASMMPRLAKKGGSGDKKPSGGGRCALCTGLCSFVKGMLLPFSAKPDAELGINEPLSARNPYMPFNGRRVFTPFPSISMDRVGAIRKKHNCTVNDAVMAALTGALRRYDIEVRKDTGLKEATEKLEFKSMLMIGLPRPVDEADLAKSLTNRMLFASCPLPIEEPSAMGRLRRVEAACGNLKSKSYMAGLKGMTDCLKGVAPTSVIQKAASETMCAHTLLVTNMPGPSVPVTWPEEQGRPMQEIQMAFPNIISQVSVVSYAGKISANIVADPELFPDAGLLGGFWDAEFNVLAEADPE